MAMKTALIVGVALLTVAGCSSSKQLAFNTKERSEDTYVIMAHTVVPAKEYSPQEDHYTVVYGGHKCSGSRILEFTERPFDETWRGPWEDALA
jgi:uncharacterized protein YcfL